MTVVLKRWHWALFLALSLAQIGGWILLARSSLIIFTADFLQRAGWFTRFAVPVSYTISVAFTDTVIIAKLTEVFAKQKP
ncbi:MAG: hypothetical protein WAQ52_15490 [Terriglobales bacterium]